MNTAGGDGDGGAGKTTQRSAVMGPRCGHEVPMVMLVMEFTAGTEYGPKELEYTRGDT